MSSFEKKGNRSKLKAAIIPSTGIGDAVIFLQAAQALKEKGYQVSLYHPTIKNLDLYFPSFSMLPRIPSLKNILFSYDLILAQYDDSKETKDILSIKKKHPNFYLFYPSYKKDKHGPLTPLDFVSDPNKSMLKNLLSALNQKFGINKITPPLPLLKKELHRKNKKQVLLHPLSNNIQKNWSFKKYLLLAKYLKKQGFSPVFVMSPKEKVLHPINEFPVANSPSLADLAALIHQSAYFIGNDSGPGHLASLLKIPSIIISNDLKRMKLWKPDYHAVKIITPPPWVPNLKGMRLREKYWSFFIRVSSVTRALLSSVENN